MVAALNQGDQEEEQQQTFKQTPSFVMSAEVLTSEEIVEKKRLEVELGSPSRAVDAGGEIGE